MTKNISDEELANVSGAGDEMTPDKDFNPKIKGDLESGSGPGGPAETPDTAVTGNDPADLDRQCRRSNERHDLLAAELAGIEHIRVPKRQAKEGYVGSSLQFTLTDVDHAAVEIFLNTCAQRGVEIKWFGAKEPVGFTSSWESWQYVKDHQSLPQTRKTLDFLCDFRIPLTFSLEDCKTVATVIKQVTAEVFR